MTFHSQLALLTVPILLVVLGWVVRQWHLSIKEHLDGLDARARTLEREIVRLDALREGLQRLDRKVHTLEHRYLNHLEREESGAEA